MPAFLANLITPATVIAAAAFVQRSADAQVQALREFAAAQKASTDAQVQALREATAAQKASTDAQVQAVSDVADAYRAILQQLVSVRGGGGGAE